MRNRVLMIAAAAEVLTGFVLLWSPSIIVKLLFGDGIAGAGIIMSRVALDDFDLAIASCALANNLILVTNNTKHFSRINGLRISNWTVYQEKKIQHS